MAKRRRTTQKQRAASRRNLEIARRMKKRGSSRRGFKKAYKRLRSEGMTKSIARNTAWGMIRNR